MWQLPTVMSMRCSHRQVDQKQEQAEAKMDTKRKKKTERKLRTVCRFPKNGLIDKDKDKVKAAGKLPSKKKTEKDKGPPFRLLIH